LFFHAEWCPVCRAMEANIEENEDQIPADVALLKVDYDTEEELKQEYGITQQSVWVLLDAEGNEVARNPGVNFDSLVEDLEELV
ncbi:redoxin domain-containing protein, partial [Candidatus Peregrinibacteria bacterium]|nr:redoxin domain-containing protein [Candidatus Peregrinibacteria bacterium]